MLAAPSGCQIGFLISVEVFVFNPQQQRLMLVPAQVGLLKSFRRDTYVERPQQE